MRCVGKDNAVREIREIITLVFSSDAARRRPYPLTTLANMLFAVFEYKGL